MFRPLDEDMMGRLRNLAKRVAERVARRAAQDELFEKPGERAPTAPLRSAEPEPQDDDEEPQSAEADAPSSDAPAVRVADSAAILRETAPDGRPLVVHHWATWCAPCEEELPEVQALFQDIQARGRLVGLSWDAFEGGAPQQLAQEVEEYAHDLGLTWPTLVVSDAPEDFFEALGLEFQRIPQTWVFDGAGAVLLRVDGAMDADQLARVRALMG